MKWVTREKVKVDRVACPWLIRKFIDTQAEFLFVPADKVMEVADREGAIPFDVPGVELGHHGKECTFDALVKKRQLGSDPAIVLLAKIVNGAIRITHFGTNRKRPDSTRSPRVFAISASRMTWR
jgi:hypothetical protein